MASGMLTGKMTRERLKNLPGDDWRRKHKFFKEPQLSRNLELVALLEKIAGCHKTSVGAVAIAWTLLNPAVTGAIVGCRQPEQVDEIINAHTIELTGSEFQDIDDFMRRNP
jgi:aryl-alcohol dehydrogenase-like predicted oxidoreductase